MLNNVFKTAGLNGEQPWKEYYKGIKPKNPLGGDFVHRMGNKVKPVVSSSTTKQMQFSFMSTNLSNFNYTENPQKKSKKNVKTVTNSVAPVLSEKERLKKESLERARQREGRQEIANTRANYRAVLDTVREARGWGNSLGLFR